VTQSHNARDLALALASTSRALAGRVICRCSSEGSRRSAGRSQEGRGGCEGC